MIKGEVGAVIVGAGSGERMGGGDKMTALLGGKPVLARVTETFQECGVVSRMVLVLSEPNLEWGRGLVDEYGWDKVSSICPGGARRQDSVANGLKCLGRCDWVIIHDGARPLVTGDMIIRGLKEAAAVGAAVAAVPVTDTIKIAGDDKIVRETPLRKELWSVQTPQVFRYDIITEAYQKMTAAATDDASLVERLGYKVKLYPGAYDNIKITTPRDLALAEVLWRDNYGK